MGPPISASPSISSFSSQPSLEQNLEIQRLRLALTASQENLRIQREYFERRTQTQEEMFDSEREVWKATLRDLQEGSSSGRRERRK